MSQEFYRELAPVYHLKVDWENRSRLESELFRYLLETYKPLRVLDIGCGDGGHASWFTRRKIEYVGVDLSEEMIDRAAARFARSKKARFQVGDMAQLSKLGLKGKFDLILNLGNSLPHLLEQKQLNGFLSGCARILAKDGATVLQSVNPEQLNGKNVFFPTPRLQGGHLFSPIYVRRGRIWEFYMQVYRVRGDRISDRKVLRTNLRLWSAKQLQSSAESYNLHRAAIFGSAQLDQWNSDTSTNIVMILEK